MVRTQCEDMMWTHSEDTVRTQCEDMMWTHSEDTVWTQGEDMMWTHSEDMMWTHSEDTVWTTCEMLQRSHLTGADIDLSLCIVEKDSQISAVLISICLEQGSGNQSESVSGETVRLRQRLNCDGVQAARVLAVESHRPSEDQPVAADSPSSQLRDQCASQGS
ncbi:unnamed protein product [Pleuronectes platessa]|uniref:Uncharacterized protein n=1 Tax=Pleuronectes platessa TaxID=8262 RepID=A0A9N7Y629_PLEPL|nr:unnamed protein product [Pleuronectes platessa]